jgi:hypothetical protein
LVEDFLHFTAAGNEPQVVVRRGIHDYKVAGRVVFPQPLYLCSSLGLGTVLAGISECMTSCRAFMRAT